MANNGMITKIWGSAGWLFNHTVTFGFPLQPTDQQREDYLAYFRLLGEVLPCGYCRDSYRRFIEEPDTRLDRRVVENRETLTRWFYQIHEKVNRKLGLRYLITFADVVRRYESFRARCTGGHQALGCTDPLRRGYSFREAKREAAPVIPMALAAQYLRMAEIRGLDLETDGAWYRAVRERVDDNDLWSLVETPLWEARDEHCVEIIRYMREHGIPTLEAEGPWQGYPTREELLLILHLCSQVNLEELTAIAQRVG